MTGETQAAVPARVSAVPAATADEHCLCCDLPWYSCGAELERRQANDARALRQRALHQPGVIASRHPGVCVCGEFFDRDSPIRKREGRWQAVLCCGLDDL